MKVKHQRSIQILIKSLFCYTEGNAHIVQLCKYMLRVLPFLDIEDTDDSWQ